MAKKAHDKRKIAVFLTAVYLFVALFSQHFHQHAEPVFSTGKTAFSAEKYSEKSTLSTAADCLSCHLLHAGKVLLPADFQVFLFQSPTSFTEVSDFVENVKRASLLCRQQRGPPVIFS